MLIKKTSPDDVKPSEITPKTVYLQRRRFIQQGTYAFAGLASAGLITPAQAKQGAKIYAGVKPGPFNADDKITDYDDATSYNNFYEFGTGKGDPVDNAQQFKPRPWSVSVEGECDKPGNFDLEDILKPQALEERIYRFRCVEAWSMVVPWIGFPLGELLKRFAPRSSAKYVAFETLYDPKRMPGQKRRVLDWPYREGLRMDEAMHPLAFIAVGMYDETLPNQNGAPLRLVVPWKYGFKSIKSIVKIRFTEQQPPTSWNMAAAREYGFYSNVNPTVDHPRWSQRKERRLGDGLFTPKRKTLMFNGYEAQVASLYAGMDLRKFF